MQGSGLAAVPIWDAATLRTFAQLKQVAYHLQHGFETTKLAFLGRPTRPADFSPVAASLRCATLHASTIVH